MTRLFTPLRLLLLAILIIAVVAGFALVPADASLPVHWGPDGRPDGFASRDIALLWPLGVTAVAWGIFALIGRVASPATVEAGRHPSGAVLTGLTALFAVIAIVTVLIGAGVAVSMVQAVAFAVSALLLLMGNALPKSQPNSVAGIRIPTTLGDAANWQATHRFTGWLSMAGGLVLLLGAAFVPDAVLVWLLIACIVVPILAGTLYSLALARRRPARP